MRQRINCAVLLLSLPLLSSCGAGSTVAGLLGVDRVKVRLLNNTEFDVDVRLFTAEEQQIPEDTIDDVGMEHSYLIEAGQSAMFDDDCDQIQAIRIDRAELRVLEDIFCPDEESPILRDGDDFNCGSTITFTFSGRALNFRVDDEVTRR